MSIFSNPDLVTNVRSVATPMSLATNAGTRSVTKEATVPGFGTVWYNPDAIANIFGFVDLKRQHQVTYDSAKEDAFLVHMHGKVVKFECSQD